MQHRNKTLLIVFITLLMFFAGPMLVLAAEGVGDPGFTNPLEGTDSPVDFLGNIIKFLLGLVGALSLLAIIWGGIMYITALGDDKRIQKGKTILFWAIAGLVVIVLAYTIIDTVIKALNVR